MLFEMFYDFFCLGGILSFYLAFKSVFKFDF